MYNEYVTNVTHLTGKESEPMSKVLISHDHENLVTVEHFDKCQETFSGTDEHGNHRSDWLNEEFIEVMEDCDCYRCLARNG